MHPGCNFEIWLSDGGTVVPKSYRVGHNVFTDFGKEWLRDLVALYAFGDAEGAVGVDIQKTAYRLRWVAVGGVSSYLELPTVTQLHTEALISGSNLRKVLPVPTFPTNFSVRYAITFAGAELPDPINVVEAGLFVDVDAGAGPVFGPTVAGVSPVAYKSFPPLPTKTVAQSLNLVWEFRF